MNKAENRCVMVPAGMIVYTLERKKVKNLNLRVRSDGWVCVSANRLWPVEKIDAFVISRAGFIFNAQSRLREKAALALPRDESVFYLLGKQLKTEAVQSAAEKVEAAGDVLRIYMKNPSAEGRKKQLLEAFREEMCRTVFSDSLERMYPPFEKWGIAKPGLRQRDMKSRWGSCQVVKRIITMNKRLIAAPLSCIDYVMCHELCHLIHPDHSKAFYALLGHLLPQWKMQKQLLDQAGKTYL